VVNHGNQNGELLEAVHLFFQKTKFFLSNFPVYAVFRKD